MIESVRAQTAGSHLCVCFVPDWWYELTETCRFFEKFLLAAAQGAEITEEQTENMETVALCEIR